MQGILRFTTAVIVAALACSATVVAMPAVASAAPVAQLFDIWNLTSTDVKITGYEKPNNYTMVPKDKLPPDTVIPIGRNLQVSVEEEHGAIAHLAGRQQTPQGGAQTWEVSTLLEGASEWLPAPLVHMFCHPVDAKNSACGVSVGPNVSSLADGPGTKVTVPASDVQQQAEIKNNLCGNPYTKQLHISCTDSAEALTVSAGNTIWTLPHK